MEEARFCNPEFMALELVRLHGSLAAELVRWIVNYRVEAFSDERLREVAGYGLEFAFLYIIAALRPTSRRLECAGELLKLGLTDGESKRATALDVLAIEVLTGAEYDLNVGAYLPNGQPSEGGRMLQCYLMFRTCSDCLRDQAVQQLLALLEDIRHHPGYGALAAAFVSEQAASEYGRHDVPLCPLAGKCDVYCFINNEPTVASDLPEALEFCLVTRD